MESLEEKYGALFDNGSDRKFDIATAMLGRMGYDESFEHSIPNAWMASTPGHPFFLRSIQEFEDLFNQSEHSSLSFEWPAPEHLTGPVALRSALLQYEETKTHRNGLVNQYVEDLVQRLPFAAHPPKDHHVLVLPSHMVYPYSWDSDGSSFRDECWVLREGFDPDRCKNSLRTKRKGTISITYWSHSHTIFGHDVDNMRHLEDKMS